MAPGSVVFCPNFKCVWFDKPAVFRKLPPPVLPREASRGCEGSGDLALRLRSPQLLPRFANLRETGGMTRGREREAKGGAERRGGAVPGSMQTAAV